MAPIISLQPIAHENFTVRKISYGEGVERVFPIHSPLIDSIEVVRHGRVRRAKLYYLRDLRGKASRIAEDTEAQRELIAVQAEEAAKAFVPMKPGDDPAAVEHDDPIGLAHGRQPVRDDQRRRSADG